MSGIIGISPDMRSGVVGKFPTGTTIQTKVVGYSGGAFNYNSASSNPSTTLMTTTMLCTANSKVWVMFTSGQIGPDGKGATTNGTAALYVHPAGGSATSMSGNTNHIGYGADQRDHNTLQGITGVLAAGTHTFYVKLWGYNGTISWNFQDSYTGRLALMEIAG